jgi:hypothetical protein
VRLVYKKISPGHFEPPCTYIHTYTENGDRLSLYLPQERKKDRETKYVNKLIQVETFVAKFHLGKIPSVLQKIGMPLIFKVAYLEAPQN